MPKPDPPNQVDPRLATLAASLQARLEMEQSLGVEHIAWHTLPAGEILPPRAVEDHPWAPGREAAAPAQPAHVEEPPPVPVTASPREPRTASCGRSSRQVEPNQTGSPEKLAAIAPVVEEALSCTRCRLCEKRTQVVFGEGDLDTDLVFVGEGPGRDEDRQGQPFAGRAGRYLSRMIEGGMKRPRSSVYICNIIKCRPPGNRDPLSDEQEACTPYLHEQLAVIRPRVVVAVGRIAANYLTGQTLPAEKLRGNWFEYRGIPLMPIYHTLFLLRQREAQGRGNDFEQKTWRDIQEVMKRLG